MLVLRRVAGHYRVGERGVRLDDAIVTKHLQGTKVLGEHVFEPLSSESKGAEIFVDNLQQFRRLSITKLGVRLSKLSHIVAHVTLIFIDYTFTGRPKGLNGILLSFLHLCFVTVINDGDTLSCMDLIGPD